MPGGTMSRKMRINTVIVSGLQTAKLSAAG
jgi:hypothetical protein